jgi:hypothetical protein
MPRPLPNRVLQQRIPQTHTEITISTNPGFWVVVYQDQPITAIRQNCYSDTKHYYRTGYPQPAHAERMAARLNKLFTTTDFTVRKVI